MTADDLARAVECKPHHWRVYLSTGEEVLGVSVVWRLPDGTFRGLEQLDESETTRANPCVILNTTARGIV